MIFSHLDMPHARSPAGNFRYTWGHLFLFSTFGISYFFNCHDYLKKIKVSRLVYFKQLLLQFRETMNARDHVSNRSFLLQSPGPGMPAGYPGPRC